MTIFLIASQVNSCSEWKVPHHAHSVPQFDGGKVSNLLRKQSFSTSIMITVFELMRNSVLKLKFIKFI